MSHHVLAVIRMVGLEPVYDDPVMVASNMTEPMSMPRYGLKSGRWAAGWMMVGAGHTGRYAHRNIDDDIMEEEEEAKEKGKLEGEGGGDAEDGEPAAEDADDDNRAGMKYFHMQTCIHTLDCLLVCMCGSALSQKARRLLTHIYSYCMYSYVYVVVPMFSRCLISESCPNSEQSFHAS